MESRFHEVPQCDNLDQVQTVTHWGPVFEAFLTSLAAKFEANAVLHFCSPYVSLCTGLSKLVSAANTPRPSESGAAKLLVNHLPYLILVLFISLLSRCLG